METVQYFATTTKGLEEITISELKMLGAQEISKSSNGISFQGDILLGYKACLWLRCANRVLMNIRHFNAQTPEELYENIISVPWEEYFSLQKRIVVHATLKETHFLNSHYVSLKAKDGIVDRFRNKFGSRPDVDTKSPDISIYVHVEKDRFSLSLDIAGEGLHKRGYRVKKGKAPLKETLAAGIVRFTEYGPGKVFMDGMCGSGTLAIEAALIGLNIAPGLLHPDFSFQHLRHFDHRAWGQILKDAQDRRSYKLEFPIIASDIDERAVQTTRANLREAGLDRMVKCVCKDICDLEKEDQEGIVICNPPYGERLGEVEELKSLYTAIGDTYKNYFRGYEGYIFTGSHELSKCVGLRSKKEVILFNGRIESRLLGYDLY